MSCSGHQEHYATCTTTRKLVGDVDLFLLHCLNPERYPFLLQSTSTDNTTGRFDILFAFPQERLELNDAKLTLQRAEQEIPAPEKTFLRSLDALHKYAREQNSINEFDEADFSLPFRGGWFVYLGYELSREIEPTLPATPKADPKLPDACAVRIPSAIIYDRKTRQYTAISEKNTLTNLAIIQHDWQHLLQKKYIPAHSLNSAVEVLEEPHSRYLDGVAQIKHYIKEGDVFQVNFSRLWQANFHGLGYQAIYPVMHKVNPAPFTGMAKLGEYVIVSMSPERLVSVNSARVVEVRPIAGTRPRGENSQADQALSRELLQHAKEQAEHIMLVDLERNDLGRVCEPGSVEVSEMMCLESYATVHHIVSNVRGLLRSCITPGQVIAAVFPGGTITGCPKVRCMEIISELEQEARQAYTGSMGYINHNGSMDLNILIRTMQMHGNEAKFRSGAGIVHDSIAQNELEETRAKAKGILNIFNCLRIK